jgi:hypothetical protein
MGGKGMNARLSTFAKDNYPESKSDFFAMFIERGFGLLVERGYNAMVTMQSWMFLSSYEKMRQRLLDEVTIECMVHMGNMVMGIAFGTAATVWNKSYRENYKGAFCYVEYNDIGSDGKPVSPCLRIMLKVSQILMELDSLTKPRNMSLLIHCQETTK